MNHASNSPESQDRAFNRIGELMRQLNDTLQEVGCERLIDKAMPATPCTQDRLAYIAKLTEQAACRVLNATDVAMLIQKGLQSGAKSLGARWQEFDAKRLSAEEFALLSTDTKLFLAEQVSQQTEATNAQLTEIMMAQDFQDLTGQVIKKISALTHDMETRLMEVLVDLIPDSRRSKEVNTLLNGPVIDVAGSGEVAITQSQVDDLLDSLGF